MSHSSIKMAPIEIDEEEPILNGLFRPKNTIYRELLPENLHILAWCAVYP